jgi:hypothetical protein
MDRNVPKAVYKELETEIRQALDANDKEAVEDLMVEMRNVGIRVQDFPPDLQRKLEGYEEDI